MNIHHEIAAGANGYLLFDLMMSLNHQQCLLTHLGVIRLGASATHDVSKVGQSQIIRQTTMVHASCEDTIEMTKQDP